MLPVWKEEICKGRLFTMAFEGQGRRDERSGYVVKMSVVNQAVDDKWFEEALKICFSTDRGVVMEDGLIVFTQADYVGDERGFLEKQANELMAVLITHPKWGDKGGPNHLGFKSKKRLVKDAFLSVESQLTMC